MRTVRVAVALLAAALALLFEVGCGAKSTSGTTKTSGPKLVAHDYYTGNGAAVMTGVDIYEVDGEVKGVGTDYKVKVVGSHRAYVLIQQSASTMHRELPGKKFVKKSPVTFRYHCKEKCSINVTAQLWCKPAAQKEHCAPGSDIPTGRIDAWIWKVK